MGTLRIDKMIDSLYILRNDKCFFNYEDYEWIFEKMTLKIKLFIMNFVFLRKVSETLPEVGLPILVFAVSFLFFI